ncbi:uncharacterized protein LOC128326012 isoform X2 [Hemicordylus capensis]|uniref:uncharacterized protein LOC128326012 isoform X2 n=1 Tax=Hemicordylus capensis TaxID=884348 RepID=UPI00230305FB|nr:uncharacterized protein LOC128326012 isoform X2 [Hemicordylus capensis]
MVKYFTVLRTMAEILEQGPVYFFDQPKIKKKWVKKMGPGEQLTDLNTTSANPHETGCIHRNSGYTEEHLEGNDTLLKHNTAEKDPGSLQIHGPSIFRTTCEDPPIQLCQISSALLTEEAVVHATLLDEYKCMALTILCELEEMLNHFSKYKFILPKGISNILTYSWKELVEDASYNKKSWQELACKNIKSARRKTSEEECNKLSPTSEYMDNEMVGNIARQCRRASISITKETKPPKILSKRLSGNKTVVPQEYANDSSVAISFSLSSKLSEERGWAVPHADSDSKDPEWKVPYIWAVERLRLAKIQIVKQLSKLEESGFDKPIILRHFDDVKKENVPKNRGWTCKKIFSEVLKEKPQLPVIKQAGPAFKKLHYGLVDGSSFIYYPSGYFAVCQSYSNLPGGGMYTNIFNDFPDRTLLGTFTPFGDGSICLPDSNNIAMIFNQEGGMMTNKGGEMLREWKWPGVGKLDDPVIIQVNKCITVRIAGRFAVCLVYKCQHESVRLSLSPVQGVAVPQTGILGQILSSKPLKGFYKIHNEEEEATNTSKKVSDLSKVTKTSGIPEEDRSHFKDFSASKELKKLRRKIKNILEDWLNYYRIALGITSPNMQKTSVFPPRPGKQCKIQLAGASPELPAPQREKNSGRKAPVSDYRRPFRCAPACHRIHHASLGSFRAPYLLSNILKIKQPFITRVNKDKPISQVSLRAREKSWYTHIACPAALRRSILGNEGEICRCSSHHIPYITDLEYNYIIKNQVSSPEQITVVCVTSSLNATDDDSSPDKQLEHLYERKNKNRSMPCIQGRLDSFRLLKYDIDSADEFTNHRGSLLVERHNVAPGMFLMYVQGRLLFANYIFNGYSKSVKDLLKQIALTRSAYNRGYYLPPDYRFSSLANSLQTYSECAQARIPEDVSRCVCYATDRGESAHEFKLFSLYRGTTSFGIQKQIK